MAGPLRSGSYGAADPSTAPQEPTVPTFALELKSISGIPLHPLIVHIPVMMVPLAFLGAVLALVRPPWRSWALPLTAVFAGVALAGVQLAMQSGEGLEELLDEESALIERHSQLAEQARPIVFAFFLLAVAAAVIFHLVARADGRGEPDAGRVPLLRKLLVPVMALSVLTGALSLTWVYRTGHTGAESVWKGEGEKAEKEEKGAQPEGSDEGREPSGDGDDDGD
jgi:hypothetical protein